MSTSRENNVEVDNLLALVNQIDSLPTLPDVVEKLMFQLYDSKTTAETLAKSMSSDTALVGKILKLVNSAYYGFPKKISTVTQAIVFLGFNSLKNIVLTASVFSAFEGNGKTSYYDRKKFWEHSLACAVMSKILCKYMRAGLPEEAFFAGLFHDIGKIVVDHYIHEKFVQIIKIAEQKNLTFMEAEKKVLGTDHAEIGNWLCEKWNFPSIYLDAVYYHHDPGKNPSQNKMVELVHFANEWVKFKGFSVTAVDQKKNFDKKHLEFINLSEEEFLEMDQDFHEDYKKANIFLELAK